MKLLVNYANKIYRHSQNLNSKTGKQKGGFDQVISYSPKDIDPVFFGQNKNILSQRRGNGYWLWKPYFIHKSLSALDEGDFLFYSDSGAHFIRSIDPLVEICLRTGQDLIPFELTLLEQHWTKRDVFILMNCDTPEFVESRQRLGGFSFWRKSDFTMHFIQELLRLARDERLLTDRENTLGYPNYPGFKEHRHDQSLFSLLTKKYGLQGFRNPSQKGNLNKDWYPNSSYDQLIQLTRQRSTPLWTTAIPRIKRRILRIKTQIRNRTFLRWLNQ